MSTFREYWVGRYGPNQPYGSLDEATWEGGRQEGSRAERERCALEALEFCHCSEHYTARGLIDPTCDCHDIAAAIREGDIP